MNRLQYLAVTPPKLNIDTKNDGLENGSPFKHGYFRYLVSMSNLISKEREVVGLGHKWF